ncbi:MAG: hypothetical protein HQL99_06590 [Magnetococcales bacterium]|nr:hypothetical protein [Magnetococcales bacterium]
MKRGEGGLGKGWETLLAKVDRLSRRERIQLVVMLVVVLGAGWFQGVLEPFRKEQVLLRKQKSSVENGLREMSTLEQEVLARKDKNPDASAQERIASLKQELAALDQQLGAGVVGMVTPPEMVQALKGMLTPDSGLTLVSLEALPPQDLLAGDDSGGAVYQHNLMLRFSGAFPDVLKYLRDLERLPWKLFWDGVEFAVADFPKSYVTLRIHTLSLSSDLVGGNATPP